MITLVGVGHVFDIGARVRDVVLARRPKVVALELDPLRYSALLSRRREARGVSLLHLLASLESKIAREYGAQGGGGVRGGEGPERCRGEGPGRGGTRGVPCGRARGGRGVRRGASRPRPGRRT